MPIRLFAVVLAVVLSTAAGVAPAGEPKLLGVQKVWDAAPHNAFTDLIRFKDRWWLAFREAKEHGNSPDGSLRLLVSDDGQKWSSAARLTHPEGDLRDPKLSVMPDGRLMIATVVAYVGEGGAAKLAEKVRHQSLAYFSNNGLLWDGPHAIGDPNYWLWRVTWREKTAYSFGYSTVESGRVRLYQSEDGRKFTTLVEDLKLPGTANEITLRFAPGGTAMALARRDPEPALWLTAKPPFKEWNSQPLDLRAGGPNFLSLPNGPLVAAARLHAPKVHTALAWIHPANGKLEPFITLPSEGDTSYAGLVWHDRVLWVSYYSSHGAKTSIYLARVTVWQPEL